MGRKVSKLFAGILTSVVLIVGFGSQAANARSLTIKSINDIKATINQGTKYSLPKTVTAVMSNNLKKSVAVRWNVKSISTSRVGTFNYYGKVFNYKRNIKLTLTVKQPEVFKLITSKTADLDGDKKNDLIYLYGYNSFGEKNYAEKIKLVIRLGNGRELTAVENVWGYWAALNLVDFTGDKKKDIQVVLDCGGTAGTEYTYIYSVSSGKLIKNASNQIDGSFKDIGVTFMDDYKVKVYSKTMNKSYVVSFLRNKEYYNESGYYYSDGKLKDASNFYGLNQGPYYSYKDINNDGVFEVGKSIDIDGENNGDTLAIVNMYYRLVNGKWKIADFKISSSTLSYEDSSQKFTSEDINSLYPLIETYQKDLNDEMPILKAAEYELASLTSNADYYTRQSVLDKYYNQIKQKFGSFYTENMLLGYRYGDMINYEAGSNIDAKYDYTVDKITINRILHKNPQDMAVEVTKHFTYGNGSEKSKISILGFKYENGIWKLEEADE